MNCSTFFQMKSRFSHSFWLESALFGPVQNCRKKFFYRFFAFLKLSPLPLWHHSCKGLIYTEEGRDRLYDPLATCESHKVPIPDSAHRAEEYKASQNEKRKLPFLHTAKRKQAP
jgi:hypothetical protein